MEQTLTIVGCGWHAHIVAELAELSGKYAQIQFLDRDWPAKMVWGDWPVVGGFDVLETDLLKTLGDFFVALGNNCVRTALCAEIVKNGGKLSTLIHPKAFVSPRACIQAGTVICAGAIVQPYAKIGMGCIVNTAATVDHHCNLADGVHLSPGVHVSGNVHIGKKTWLGTGVSVRDKLTIGENIIVGAGAAVVNDISEVGIYSGVPSKMIKNL